MNEYQQKALPYIEAGLKQGAAHVVAFSIEDIVFDSRSLLKCMFGGMGKELYLSFGQQRDYGAV